MRDRETIDIYEGERGNRGLKIVVGRSDIDVQGRGNWGGEGRRRKGQLLHYG